MRAKYLSMTIVSAALSGAFGSAFAENAVTLAEASGPIGQPSLSYSSDLNAPSQVSMSGESNEGLRW
jgi:hypothetical protein